MPEALQDRIAVLHAERERRVAHVPPTIDGRDLTLRQREIIALLANGFSTEAIALKLSISPHTVRSHLKKVFVVLGAWNRANLLALVEGGGGDAS